MSSRARWTKEQFNAWVKTDKPFTPVAAKKSVKTDRYRNSWERDFAKEILHIKLIRAEISHYDYEPGEYRLAPKLKIIPDFVAKNFNGLDIYEVKCPKRRGYQKWLVKWKVFKEKYSWMFNHFYVAEKINGSWQIQER